MVLSLRIALLRLSPAATRGPAAPSHGGRGRLSGLAEVAVVHGRATGLSRRRGRARGVALRRGGALKAGPPPPPRETSLGRSLGQRPAQGRGSGRVGRAGAEPRAGEAEKATGGTSPQIPKAKRLLDEQGSGTLYPNPQGWN